MTTATALPEPQTAVEGGRAWLMCRTPGCRKRLAEVAPGTRLAAGAIVFRCRSCKAEYRLAPETDAGRRAP